MTAAAARIVAPGSPLFHPESHRARRGPPAEQTGVRVALAFVPLDAEAEEALVRILADALVADFIDETRRDGRNPTGTRPSDSEAR